MKDYVLYNNDVPVAEFGLSGGIIQAFRPLRKELLPMQLRNATPDGFSLWLQARSIDLNTFQHRQLAQSLIGSRDKLSIAIATHMFSISDTFTCFEEKSFTPRAHLCSPSSHERVSNFILVSSDTSLNRAGIITPNISTDGSFTKTWRFENGEWWLYKLQSTDATKSECEIAKALLASGFDAAEYRYVGSYRKRIKTRNFVDKDEFFEPYESLRFMFHDRSDDDQDIYRNIASLGEQFAMSWRCILLADALFMNTDRHMRNFGVIRSAATGDILRMAPNFDNNQAYKANPGGLYSGAMLKLFNASYGFSAQDREKLERLVAECGKSNYMKAATEVGRDFLGAKTICM